MDNRVSVRFFRVRRAHDSGPTFEQALSAAHASGTTPFLRQRDLSYGVKVRLEKLSTDGSFLEGEMVRRQSSNFPPEATDVGLTPLQLSQGGGLGHRIAFRYSPGLQVIALQFDIRAVSMSRMLEYLKKGDAAAEFEAAPLVRHDAWERYNRGQPKTFQIEIADPANLPAVEGRVDRITESSKRFAELYGGPIIKLEVTMGRREGSLFKQTIDDTINYFTRGAGRDAGLQRLSVKVKPDDGPMDSVDFIDELLIIRDTLDLPDNNLDGHYAIRRQFVRDCFDNNIDYIRRVYGAPP